MKYYITLIILLFITIVACNNQLPKSSTNDELIDNENYQSIIHTKELNIFTKFETPTSYKRSKITTDFGKWLNNISLKNNNVPVYTFDGKRKPNPNVYVGVLDLEQPKKNVQFNTNAIISLRAEFFYRSKKYAELDKLVNFSDKLTPYTKYVKGDYSYSKYMEYLTYFLENTTPNTIKDFLKSISMKDIQVGDVLFQKGSTKSHAVIVMDMATDNKGDKIIILAQSYYPSQDIQIVANPSNDFISPWYQATEGVILTPEWRFLSSDLMRFK